MNETNKIMQIHSYDILKVSELNITSLSQIGNVNIAPAGTAVFDPNKTDASKVVENNGTRIRSIAEEYKSSMTDIGVNKGKIYFEAEWTVKQQDIYRAGFGISDNTFDWTLHLPMTQTNIISWTSTINNIYIQGSTISGASWYSVPIVLGMAVDIPNKLVWFMQNGTWLNGGNPSAGTGGESFTLNTPLYIWGYTYYIDDYIDFYFDNWNYTPPTGFESPSHSLI